MSTTTLRSRIDPEIHQAALSVLAERGITITEVITKVLKDIAELGYLPPYLCVPNRDTVTAVEESRRLMADKKNRKE